MRVKKWSVITVLLLSGKLCLGQVPQMGDWRPFYSYEILEHGTENPNLPAVKINFDGGDFELPIDGTKFFEFIMAKVINMKGGLYYVQYGMDVDGFVKYRFSDPFPTSGCPNVCSNTDRSTGIGIYKGDGDTVWVELFKGGSTPQYWDRLHLAPNAGYEHKYKIELIVASLVEKEKCECIKIYPDGLVRIYKYE